MKTKDNKKNEIGQEELEYVLTDKPVAHVWYIPYLKLFIYPPHVTWLQLSVESFNFRYLWSEILYFYLPKKRSRFLFCELFFAWWERTESSPSELSKYWQTRCQTRDGHWSDKIIFHIHTLDFYFHMQNAHHVEPSCGKGLTLQCQRLYFSRHGSICPIFRICSWHFQKKALILPFVARLLQPWETIRSFYCVLHRVSSWLHQKWLNGLPPLLSFNSIAFQSN